MSLKEILKHRPKTGCTKFALTSSAFLGAYTDNVSCHAAKLKTLWNELNTDLQQKGGNKLPNMMLICKILNILPSEYQMFKTS